jgi:hypothetical protein
LSWAFVVAVGNKPEKSSRQKDGLTANFFDFHVVVSRIAFGIWCKYIVMEGDLSSNN